MSLKIRRMRRTDAVAVAEMMKKLSAFHGDSSTAKARDFIHHCLGAHKRAYIWVAFFKSKPAGFAYAYDVYSFVINGFERNLNLLYVDEPFRRKGVGRALVSCVAKDAAGKKCALLLVKAVSGNKAANALYKNLGMAKNAAARRKNKYTVEKDALKRLAKRS